jgi:hypothetical protein
MSVPVTSSIPVPEVEHPSLQGLKEKKRWPGQVGTLCAFLIVAVAIYIVMIVVAPQLDQPIGPFMLIWWAAFLLYFAACIWVMRTRPLDGRGRWIELGLIFAGGLIFRAMLLPLPLGLSRDAWRYLWDGRIILHGFNPYLYTPLDKVLVPVRDTVVFPNTPYRDIPSEYPPGAQLFFVLGYLLMPANLLATKALFVLCDLITSLGVGVLLLRKGLDPRRLMIYAWCPLPIIEFAIQGHVDAVAIMFTVLTVVCASGTWRGARLVAGICLGLATLAKIYPLILLLALIRRRDWPLVLACALTIVLGYLPFMLFSNGHPLAAPLSFVGQSGLHPGVIPTLFFMLERHVHTVWISGNLFIDLVAASILIPVLVIVAIQRWRKRLSEELAVLLLVGSFMVASAHIFPWYAAAFVPWLALQLGPVWTREGFQARRLMFVMVWYFTCTATLSYIPGLKQYFTDTNWILYFSASFGVMLLGWLVAGILARVLSRPARHLFV